MVGCGAARGGCTAGSGAGSAGADGTASLALRPLSPAGLGAVAGHVDGLLYQTWQPVSVDLDGVGGVVGVEVFGVPVGLVGVGVAVPVRVRAVLGVVLERLQGWLGSDRGDGGGLVVVTRGAVAVGGGGVDPVQAGGWGLVRAAQAGDAGRIVLVDLD